MDFGVGEIASAMLKFFNNADCLQCACTYYYVHVSALRVCMRVVHNCKADCAKF